MRRCRSATAGPSKRRCAPGTRASPKKTGVRDWNSSGGPRVLLPVGALVSPGPNHCLHGIPSGWSHVAPFAVRRPSAPATARPRERTLPGALSYPDPFAAGRDGIRSASTEKHGERDQEDGRDGEDAVDDDDWAREVSFRRNGHERGWRGGRRGVGAVHAYPTRRYDQAEDDDDP